MKRQERLLRHSFIRPHTDVDHIDKGILRTLGRTLRRRIGPFGPRIHDRRIALRRRILRLIAALGRCRNGGRRKHHHQDQKMSNCFHHFFHSLLEQTQHRESKGKCASSALSYSKSGATRLLYDATKAKWVGNLSASGTFSAEMHRLGLFFLRFGRFGQLRPSTPVIPLLFLS